MTKGDILPYLDAASDNTDIGVTIYSLAGGDEIAVTYDLIVDINEYGEIMIIISL
jgi:hypothetical protein